MHWTKMMTAVITAGLAASVGVAATAVATTAMAAQAPAPRFGLFKSWHAAQSAAGFELIRPTKTFGQKRNGKIVVRRCVVKPTKSKNPGRLVTVTYGLTPKAQLRLSQSNSGHACSVTGRLTALGKVKVGGVTAKLSGLCGRAHLPACTSTKIFLFLTWIKHGVYYVASSFGESRVTLVGFARAARPVH